MSGLHCPACGAPGSPSQRFCGACGAVLTGADSETVTSAAVGSNAGRREESRGGPRLGRPAPTPRIPGDAWFLPGQVVAGRYRMLGLLGKGGMGEVYRADDLKLGQPVALKFLPRDVEADPGHLARFLNEVRLSLRVTHPHVCRVYDVGQVAGRHFISMEFVDGEDLASLLRRIGRLPEDKAVEIARQLCAGLQAAHDEGVLHRDLKPANVMLDGRGRAKITDFGLAGAVAGIVGREAQVGTPQYMAPEQWDGRELSLQTDLYALGLLLHELFTGKRVFDSRDLLELVRQRSSPPLLAAPTGLDPLVERAIVQCLNPDPAKRPASARALSDALPGGDPLALALAAGETPSPEVVAGAGGSGALRPWIAASLLAIVLAGLGLTWYMEGGISHAAARIPLPRTPAELQVAAQQALAAAGYTERRAGKARGFLFDGDYFRHVARTDASLHRWDGLASTTPSPLWFWYREAVSPMSPSKDFGQVSMSDPQLLTAGMTRVRLDPSGRLQELVAIPAEGPAQGPPREPDWSPIFAAAGLVEPEWTATEPRWPPYRAADARQAWTKGAMRIEATSFDGRPTWFRLIPEWRRQSRVAEAEPEAITARLFAVLSRVLGVAVFVAAVLLARRSIRQGRGDLRGATRLAAAYVAIGIVYEWSRLENTPGNWLTVFNINTAVQVYVGLLLWAGYLAVEPSVRRWWPTTLVGWSRALDGRFRDPMVGRDVLLGAALAVLFTFGPKLSVLLLMRPPDAGELGTFNHLSWTSDRAYLGALLQNLAGSFTLPIGMVLTLLVLRVMLRRTWAAYLVLSSVFLLTAISGSLSGLSLVTDHVVFMILSLLMLLIVTRLGLLTSVAAGFFGSTHALTLTANPASWYFHHSIITIGVFGGLAAWAAWTSIGNQRLFKTSVLE